MANDDVIERAEYQMSFCVTPKPCVICDQKRELVEALRASRARVAELRASLAQIRESASNSGAGLWHLSQIVGNDPSAFDIEEIGKAFNEIRDAAMAGEGEA